ncbi:MAG: glycosyltransferase family 9 protein, partial [Thermodesulfobacteriota bacterium]
MRVLKLPELFIGILVQKVINWSKIDRAIINLAGEWMGLGDVIAASPLVYAIKSASPKCKIYLILTGDKWNSIVNLMEGAPQTINVKKSFYRLRELWIHGLLNLRRPWLRTAYFYDYMAPRYRASLLGFLIGAEFRFGYDQNGMTREERPLHNTHNLPYNSIGINVFDYSNEFNCITNLKCSSSLHLAKNTLVDKGKILINALGIDCSKGLLAIHPGSSSNLQAKRWPTESFSKLAQILNSKYDISTLVILGPDDKELRNSWKEETYVCFLDNDYSIYDIAAILTCCKCLISNDSGIMNLGFSLGVPGIGLFGPTNSSKHDGWYPNSILIQSKYNFVCPPCYGTD